MTAACKRQTEWRRSSMDMYSFSRTDCCKLIPVLRCTVWKAAAHCRSWHCFQAGQKWNTPVLFIMCCSIMNVWKVECCSHIFPRNRGRTGCAPKVSRFCSSFLGIERKVLVFFLIMSEFLINEKNITGLTYWFNSTHNIFLKYSLGCRANEACKSWCIRAHPALCLIFFLKA